jgi:hypothetical protein
LRKEKANFHLELHEVTKKFTSSLGHKNFQRWIDKGPYDTEDERLKIGHQSPPPKITRPGQLDRIMG